MAKPKRINHIAILVEDMDSALKFWRDQLGLSLTHIEDVPSQHSKVAFLPAGEGEIELVQPTDTESSLAKALEKRGEGLHHICFEVENIEVMLNELKKQDVNLINETPLDLPGRRMAFIHPKSASGVLVELYQITE